MTLRNIRVRTISVATKRDRIYETLFRFVFFDDERESGFCRTHFKRWNS